MVWDSCNRGQLLVKKLPRAWRWQAQRGWLTVLGAVLAALLSWKVRLGLGLGFGVYALGLLYLYLFSFGEYEGTRVFSFWRYLGSWLLVPMLLGMALWLEQAARADHFRGLPGLLLAGSLLLFPFNTRPVNNLVSPATEIAQDRALRAAYPTEGWFEGGLGEEDRVRKALRRLHPLPQPVRFLPGLEL